MAESGGGAALRLLVIEDNLTHAKWVRSVLEALDRPVSVHHAGSLGSACQRLRAESFDLVLADLHLPDGQGISVVARITDAAPTIPIVVITASDDPALARAAFAGGVHEFLTKDQLSPEIVEHTLVRAMQRAAARDGGGGVLLDLRTGVLNRRGLEVALRRVLAFARRQDHPVTVIHLEVRGTTAEVEAFIATCLTVARGADLVGRVGDRRVVLALPDDRSNPPKILERLQANIDATPLRGVSVVTEVRRFDAQHLVDEAQLLATPADDVTPASAPMLRVLVVSDNEGLRGEVRTILEEHCTVLESTSQGQATRMAALEEPHVSVVDLEVADGAGIAVIRGINEATGDRELPIVAVVTRHPAGQPNRIGAGVVVIERSRLQADLGYEVERLARSRREKS